MSGEMITPCKVLPGNLDNNELMTLYKMIRWILRHCDNTKVTKTNQKAMKDIMLVMDARHIKIFGESVVAMEPAVSGTMYSMEDWLRFALLPEFRGSKGYFMLATGNLVSKQSIHQYFVTENLYRAIERGNPFPEWATHVVWFNK